MNPGGGSDFIRQGWVRFRSSLTPPGLLNKLLRDAELSREQFIALL